MVRYVTNQCWNKLCKIYHRIKAVPVVESSLISDLKTNVWRTYKERRKSNSLNLSPFRRKFPNLETVSAFTTRQLVGRNYFPFDTLQYVELGTHKIHVNKHTQASRHVTLHIYEYTCILAYIHIVTQLTHQMH